MFLNLYLKLIQPRNTQSEFTHSFNPHGNSHRKKNVSEFTTVTNVKAGGIQIRWCSLHPKDEQKNGERTMDGRS